MGNDPKLYVGLRHLFTFVEIPFTSEKWSNNHCELHDEYKAKTT